MTGNEFKQKLIDDREFRNQTGNCPMCNHSVKDRKVTLFAELIEAMHKVYRWCGEHKKHEFDMKEITHLLSKNCYTRFGNLKYIGGIIYPAKDPNTDKPRRGWYGMNMARAKEFFHGNRDIPVWVIINPITDEIIDEKRAKVDEFPQLKAYLDEHGQYDHERLF